MPPKGLQADRPEAFLLVVAVSCCCSIRARICFHGAKIQSKTFTSEKEAKAWAKTTEQTR